MTCELVLRAAHQSLGKLVKEYLEALDGISDEDLNTWLPGAVSNGGGEMNTFAAMSVHVIGAGSWMLFHQVFGEEVARDREAEFHATATRQEIDDLFATMLSRLADHIESDADLDLYSLPPTIRETVPDWTRAAWLFHAIDHTALHLGHAQIQRQLWLAERNMGQR
ncbi:MAG: DUF664 domain-containing protein [Thermomicrobiales bacterium]|nr:DUF664 domain-containing protein [Thermomicrobiales bacterium]